LFLTKANVFDNPRESTGIPKWAWQFKPPIPLVGRNYRPGKRLLIASQTVSPLNIQGIMFLSEVAYCTRAAAMGGSW